MEEYYGAENIEDSEIVEVEHEQPAVDVYQYKAESVGGQVYRSTRSTDNTEIKQSNENKKPRKSNINKLIDKNIFSHFNEKYLYDRWTRI